MTTLSYFECGRCRRRQQDGLRLAPCECGGPLLARYDLDKARRHWSREWLAGAPATMWRYAPVLPVGRPESIVSLGEGFTPLLSARRLAERLGCSRLWIKDDGLNPTGSAKARAFSCAVAMGVESGARKLVIAAAGNAASALAAYSAAAALDARLYAPRETPLAGYIESKSFGVQVILIDGPLNECEQAAAECARTEGRLNISILQQSYRIEGAKTTGYEIAEQSRWDLPDVIVCPTGSGAGLAGIWKAFAEMEALGWITARRPKMIAVQAAGCQPVVNAFERGEDTCGFWENAHTAAHGLRVPKPFAGFLALEAIRASGGCAVAVTDSEMLDAGAELARLEGVFAAPEGAACVAALPRLIETGRVKRDERIVLCNMGAGLRYLDVYATRYPHYGRGEADKLGGLITPR